MLIGKHHVIDNSLTNEQQVSLPVYDIMVTTSVFYTVCGGNTETHQKDVDNCGIYYLHPWVDHLNVFSF